MISVMILYALSTVSLLLFLFFFLLLFHSFCDLLYSGTDAAADAAADPGAAQDRYDDNTAPKDP